jgi:pimeloyl-ACP methyl ester carboxylesterase
VPRDTPAAAITSSITEASTPLFSEDEQSALDELAAHARAPRRTVRAAGRDIFVVEIGEGPPLLMLHGGGPGASGLPNFVRNVSALAERFRLIVPDMPGFGWSTKGVDRKDPFGDLATAMLALLDALGVERTHALGNSLGGACVLRMALEAPERVDRLVLLGPGGIDTSCRPPTEGLLQRAKAPSGKSARRSCARISYTMERRCPTR